jgi:PAS domain S-box-containing protein
MADLEKRSVAFENYTVPLLIVSCDGTIRDANVPGRDLLERAGVGLRNGDAAIADVFSPVDGQPPFPSAGHPLVSQMGVLARVRDGNPADWLDGYLRIDLVKAPDGTFGLAEWRPNETIVEMASLTAERLRYRALFDQTHDAVFILDLEGNHVEANARAADLLGYSIEEIQTVSMREVSNQVDASNAVYRDLMAGKIVPPYERVFRRKDGSLVTVELNVELVRDGDGNPMHIQSMARDITERKRQEERIAALLDEKDLLLREVHHRVKNNLSSVVQMLELEAEESGSDCAESPLRSVASRVRSMLVVYESLFTSEQYETVALMPYLEKLVDRIRESISNRPEITLSAYVTDLTVPADLAWPVGMVCNELVTNAVKHAFPEHQPGTINVRFLPDGADCVRLVVADNGVGHQLRETASESPGFGELMIQAYVERLGADLVRTSGSGTSVEITIPLSSFDTSKE